MAKRKMRKRVSENKLDAEELTEIRYENLTSQIAVILQGDLFDSMEDREKCYRANKSEILERWLSDARNYCQRPFAFWQFEKLPEKKIVGQRRWWDAVNNPGHWELSPIEEHEAIYFHRLGLLEEKEMEEYQELKTRFYDELNRLKNIDAFIPMN